MEMLMELSVWITAALSTLVMGLLKVGIGFKDTSFQALFSKVAAVDGKIVNLLKGVQPLVLSLITILLGTAGGFITGSEVPTEAAVAAAPVATVLGIVMRELWVRFVKPQLGKIQGAL